MVVQKDHGRLTAQYREVERGVCTAWRKQNSPDKTYNRGGQALQWVTWRGCEVSLLGDIQHLTGQGFGQPHLTLTGSNFRIQSGFCFAWALHQTTSRDPFQPTFLYNARIFQKRILICPFSLKD